MASRKSTNRATLLVPEIRWNPFVAQFRVCNYGTSRCPSRDTRDASYGKSVEVFKRRPPGCLAGVTASLWGAVVLAGLAGVGAMVLPPVAAEVGWARAKGDD